jgi:nucleotide-binding universal stress UspA family protein
MKKILVPTDFSTCANNAVNFAVQSAKYLPIEVTLFHAFELPAAVYTEYVGVNPVLNESLLEEVHLKLAVVKKSIEETEGVVVKTYVSTIPVVEAIIELEAQMNFDLVIMGTLGEGGLREKIWGSKTASLISKSKVPVLVIPYDYEWKKPAKFLFATNHFEDTHSIMDYLFSMVRLYKAMLNVTVITDEDDDKAETFLEHTRQLPAYEKMLKDRYNDNDLVALHLYGKTIEDTLQKYIAEHDIDILVMVTYPRKGFFERLFHPSFTQRMSYHTNIPLLAIPAK